ncbi:MAG: hypothetical protein P1U65_13260, partial [Minwuia sp.]|nr:hypothetical protein [Minwuia sp.]
TIRGEGGNDTLRGGAGSDVLFGGDGNDDVTGGDIFGLFGTEADTLAGGAGDDALSGGGGDDTYLFSAGFGQDIIRSTGAGSTDRDVLVFDESVQRQDIRLFTRNFPDDRNKSADLFIRFEPDGSTITLTNFIQDVDAEDAGQLDRGLREIRFADGQVMVFELGLELEGASGRDEMRGSQFNDTISGGEGGDRIEGNNGDDVLSGGAGNDDLFGGNGADTLIAGSGNNFIDGGPGIDVAIFTGDILAYKHDCVIDVGLLLAGDPDTVGRHIVRNVEVLIFNGTEFVFSDFENTQVLGTAGADRLDGGVERDFLGGLEGDDTIDGRDGGDFVNAGEGDDLVLGNRGDDILDGGDGFDTLSFAGESETVVVNLGAGRTSGSLGNDTLARFEVVEGGAADDLLIGDTGSNELRGGGGGDTLQGAAGGDTLTGLSGNDTFVFSDGDGPDVITDFETGDLIDLQGIVAISAFSDVQDVLSQAGSDAILDFGGGDSILLEDVTASALSATDFLLDPNNARRIVGTEGDDLLVADMLDNLIDGLGGNDTIEGLFGGDLLSGGTGADSLVGETGADTLRGGDDDDTLNGGNGDDVLDGGTGNDTLLFSTGFGNDLILASDALIAETNTLFFDSSFNKLDVRLKSFANPGDLSASLVIRHDLGGGEITINDFIDSNAGDSFGALRTGFEIIEFADGTLIDLRQGLVLRGEAQGEHMRGTNQNDQISTASGDDEVEGFAGADSLFGGQGNDTLDGGDGDDQIFGGTDSDQLSGGEGDDLLEAGLNQDTLSGGGGNDTFVFSDGDGADVITDFATGDLIDLRGVSAIGSFQDVLDRLRDLSVDSLIDIGNGDSITLEGFATSDLAEEHVLLTVNTDTPLQRIDPTVNAFIVGNGDQVSVTGVYATANPVDETLAGIGLRVHFDSSVLRFDGLENVFQFALQPFGQVVEADSGDFDGDAATDSFVALNWADFGGQFPGDGTTPLDLFDILFTGLGSTTDSNVNFSASSVALGRNFASTSVVVAADRWPLPDAITVAENSTDGILVADLAPIPIDPDDPGNFTLLDNAGGRFAIDGFVLRVADGNALDFEDTASHDLSIRITNKAGGSVDRSITVDLTDVNEAPTAIAIDSADVDEDAATGDQVGILSALDPEGGVINFTLLDDAGGRFALDGDRLVVAGGGLDFETTASHAVTVRATDTGGLSLDQVLNIGINDVVEATLDLDGDGRVNALTDGMIALGDLFGAPLSQLVTFAEPDSPGTDFQFLEDRLRDARAEIFDVDGDGVTNVLKDALTDGLMILGHLFGAPADQVAGFAAPDATRTDPAEIAAFLDSFIPVDASA